MLNFLMVHYNKLTIFMWIQDGHHCKTKLNIPSNGENILKNRNYYKRT